MSRQGYANCNHYVRHHSSPEYSDPQNWVERTYLVRVRNGDLIKLTKGRFPQPGRGKEVPEDGQHPVFLLRKNANLGFILCPCSSQEGNETNGNAMMCSYIKKGTRLSRVKKPTPIQENTYIVHQFQFILPEDNEVIGKRNFLGVVPENGIIGEEYRRSPAP